MDLQQYDDPIYDYIERHISPEPELLRNLNRDTNLHTVNGRMCSGHLQGRFLTMITKLMRPKRVIEFGTFSGYSALCLAEGLDDDASLVSIEFEDELEDRIRLWFDRSVHGHKIELRIGDALQIAASYPDNSFDMAFIDANKRQYVEYYHEALRILKPGGLMIADNTLWDGHVLESSPRSPQTIAIQEFNDMAASDKRVETVILPIRDGISLIRKNDSMF